jgi:catechol 2,3-dioxygenase-like lactoylglutathione lyase family enzyme
MTSDSREADAPVAAPVVVGLHHVRLPVSAVMRSHDWYIDVFGFEPRLRLEEEDNVVGVVVAHRGGPTLGLHYAPERARALDGFCSIALSVGDVDDLVQWCTRLDGLGVRHSAPAEGHLGWYVEVPDPDGHIIELHTIGEPAADEA